MFKRSLSILMVLMLVLSLAPVAFAETSLDDEIKGSLVIVGGALKPGNKEVYNKFIELAGGEEQAKIAIFPTASGSPHKYSKMFKEDMLHYGLIEDQIVIVPLAVRDDSRSEDVDESTWADHGNNPDVVSMLEGVTGIWFVGGDQLRITDTLYNEDGSNTLLLDKVWKIYKEGAVVGGTSAGAAIMSDVMIAGGNSLGALLHGFTKEYDATDLDQQNYGPAYVVKGLNFFRHGIIDQHFDGKSRLGRLIVVGYENRETYPLSYGVDENTALVFNNQTGDIEVAGVGGVTIVDVSKATNNSSSSVANMRNIKLSYIEGKDKFNVNTKEFTMDPDKYTTRGYEYMSVPEPMVTGVFSPRVRVNNFVAYGLVDNEAADEIRSFAYDSEGKGVALIFKNIEDSEGYWGQDGAADLYSFTNVGLDIKPISVQMTYDSEDGTPLNQPVVERKVSEEKAVLGQISMEEKIYTVQSGDVLWKIAEKFNTTVDKIKLLNDLKNVNTIFTGQRLVISK